MKKAVLSGERFIDKGISDEKYKDITHKFMREAHDPRTQYCIGMELVAEGEVDQGLQLLQRVASSDENSPANAEDAAFANAVFVQLVQMYEMRLQLGESLGASTLARLRAVRAAAEAAGDTGVAVQADTVLKRWEHRDAMGNLVIALMPESPLSLQLEPTNNCNMRCTMCPRLKMKRPVGFMEPAVFQQALEQWDYRLRVLVLPHLQGGQRIVLKRRGALKLFFMGEPLLHPQIHEYIAVGRFMGCAVGIQTNGAAFERQKLVDKILAAGPTSIGISLDGISPASYEAVRQGARWAGIQKSLRTLAERRRALGKEKSTVISICSILPEFTPEASEATAAFLEPIRPYVDSIGYIPLSREREPTFFNKEGRLTLHAQSAATKIPENSPACLEALTKLNVLYDGSVTPCCYDIDGEVSFGHVKRGIDDLWRSERAVNIRQDLVANRVHEPMCLRCLGRTQKRQGEIKPAKVSPSNKQYHF